MSIFTKQLRLDTSILNAIYFGKARGFMEKMVLFTSIYFSIEICWGVPKFFEKFLEVKTLNQNPDMEIFLDANTWLDSYRGLKELVGHFGKPLMNSTSTRPSGQSFYLYFEEKPTIMVVFFSELEQGRIIILNRWRINVIRSLINALKTLDPPKKTEWIEILNKESQIASQFTSLTIEADSVADMRHLLSMMFKGLYCQQYQEVKKRVEGL